MTIQTTNNYLLNKNEDVLVDERSDGPEKRKHCLLCGATSKRGRALTFSQRLAHKPPAVYGPLFPRQAPL